MTEFDLAAVAAVNIGVFIAAVLVLMMQPGFMLFESGRALGLEAEFEKRRAIYFDEVAVLREMLDIPQGTTWALLTPGDGAVRLANGNYNFTQVLDDLGFVPNAMTQEQIDRDVPWSEWHSVEALPQMDADVVFVHYNTAAGWGPQSLIDGFEALLPNWCDFLTACAAGNVILIPGSS
ncbi:MAG: hypothetical protein AAF909_08240, partial [Pseudomonadota bacterium]